LFSAPSAQVGITEIRKRCDEERSIKPLQSDLAIAKPKPKPFQGMDVVLNQSPTVAARKLKSRPPI